MAPLRRALLLAALVAAAAVAAAADPAPADGAAAPAVPAKPAGGAAPGEARAGGDAGGAAPASGVGAVAPALENATAAALERAHVLLGRYSEVLQAIAIPVGLVVAFAGYFMLTPVLFTAGFVTGGGASFVAVKALFGQDTPTAAWLAIIAMVLGGGLLGFLALRMLSLGMFAVGAALGVVLAQSLKEAVVAKAFPSNVHVGSIVFAVLLGAIFGVTAMYLRKQMLILSTAYAGSCGCMFGIGHFAGHFPDLHDLAKVEDGQFNPWAVAYLLAAAVLGTAGMLVQFRLAGDKPMPQHAPRDRRRGHHRVASQPDGLWSEADDAWPDDERLERARLPTHVRGSSPLDKEVELQQEEKPSRRKSWSSVTAAENIFTIAVGDGDNHAQEPDTKLERSVHDVAVESTSGAPKSDV